VLPACIRPTLGNTLQAVERELASRAASFDDRHLSIVAWSFGQLGHVPQPEALAPLLAAAEVRLSRIGGRALATLAVGLAAMQQQSQRRHQQQQQDEDGRPAAQHSLKEQPPPPQQQQQQQQQQPLIPSPLVALLVERTAQLLAANQLQPFEYAQLVHSLTALDSSGLAAKRFLQPPLSPAAAAALQQAVRRAPLPEVMGLLWAMARWRSYPAPGFPDLCARLRHTPRQYRFSQPSLALLGEALEGMGEPQREALRLRRGLADAARATARAAALRGPPAGLADHHGGSSGSDSESTTSGFFPAEGQRSQGQQRGQPSLPGFSLDQEAALDAGEQEEEQEQRQRMWGSSYEDEFAGLV
jgi:hypothetical protein